MTNEKTYLTRAEFSEAVFQAIKADLESRGFALWVEKFDPAYPVSLRTIHNIRKGVFKMDVLRRLPGIEVEEWFVLNAATEGDRAGMIRRALDLAPPNEFDYCIVGKLESISVSRGEWTGNLVEICFIGGASCRIRGEFVWPIRPKDFIKVVSWKGEVEITNLSNPPLGDKQSEK